MVMTEIDEIFVDITKIIKQKSTEERFIGRVLYKFANLENIMSRIIALHNCSRGNVEKFMLSKAHKLSADKKIKKLSKILHGLEYKNPNFNFNDRIEHLYELKKIRNQLAHNIIHPNESFKSAKTESEDIVFLIIKDGKIRKERFNKAKQNSLIKCLDDMRSTLIELHRFVKEKNNDYRPELYPA